MKKFTWGKVIDKFSYDFDGNAVEVIKYHPWEREGCTVLTGQVNNTVVLFHCEELSESWGCLDSLLISWIAHTRLGNNQHALVSGVCRALGIDD